MCDGARHKLGYGAWSVCNALSVKTYVVAAHSCSDHDRDHYRNACRNTAPTRYLLCCFQLQYTRMFYGSRVCLLDQLIVNVRYGASQKFVFHIVAFLYQM